jgi:hypothetical protein
MPNFFQKLGQGAKKFFTKTLTDPNLFRKIGNTASKIDNTVQRVGSFLQPIVTAYNPEMGMALNAGLNTSHAVTNNLEKSINAPISQIQANNHSSNSYVSPMAFN